MAAAGWSGGEEITVHGEVRTFNNRSGVGSRLIISVFAKELLLEQGGGREPPAPVRDAVQAAQPPVHAPGPDHL